MNRAISYRYVARAALLLSTLAAFNGAFADTANAVTITQWNFNTNAPGTNNNPVPSTGTGTAQMVGINGPNGDFPTASNGMGSSDPAVAPGDLSWRVRGNVNNGWSGTMSHLSGARFNTSTLGYANIGVALDINATDGSPRYAQLQVTTDGTSFASFGPLLDFNPTNDNWANGITYDFSNLPAADNNPTFGFKIVSAFSPFGFTDAGGFHPANSAFQRADADPMEGPYTGTAGNYRFDMVTFSGDVVPEPATAILIACGIASMVCTTRSSRCRRMLPCR